MLHIASLEKLIHELSRLPGIGPKTAQRLAYYILRSGAAYTERLTESLERVQAEVHDCPRCFNFTDLPLCRYCADPHRVDDILCVVEDPADVFRIESSGAFRGRYHVLHGTISPLDGIGPEKLKIRELVARIESGNIEDTGSENTGNENTKENRNIENQKTPKIREVIMALDTDLEGDTTVLYLNKLLSSQGVRVSRIAHGIPIGSDIDFIDDRTMNRALENRVEL